jgi:uracil-DNA glycosylase family 4
VEQDDAQRFVPHAFDSRCKLCPRLAAHLARMRESHPDYHNAPVPPFGAARARLLIVGLAPGAHGANATGRPFTGDHAGLLLYAALHAQGLAARPVSRAPGDGLRLHGCRITNAVKCLPPANKPSTEEVDTCNRYLAAELDCAPEVRAILALGTIAHRAVLRAVGLRLGQYGFAHGAVHRLPDGRALIDSYHCSRYNTQTRRLTPDMFAAVLRRASELAAA